jgi:hypothetical protein
MQVSNIYKAEENLESLKRICLKPNQLTSKEFVSDLFIQVYFRSIRFELPIIDDAKILSITI